MHKAVNANSPQELFESIKDFRSESAMHFYSRTFEVENDGVVEEHFVEMLKFLCLAAFEPGKVSPSEQLDEMWHALLIQTKEYAIICDRIGCFIHHSTSKAPKVVEYSDCLKLYEKHFGEPHVLWTMARLPYKEEDCEDCRIVGWCSCGNDEVAA